MKQHPVISFFIGLVISGLVLGTVYLLFLFLTFDLGGGETLPQIENQRIALLIITIIVTIIAVMTARHFLKTSRKYTAYGISALPLIAFVMVGIFYFDNLNSYTKFDRTIWEQDQWKPLNMAATLVKEKKLIGLTWQQVKEMLGKGFKEHRDDNTDRGSISYLIKEDWT